MLRCAAVAGMACFSLALSVPGPMLPGEDCSLRWSPVVLTESSTGVVVGCPACDTGFRHTRDANEVERREERHGAGKYAQSSADATIGAVFVEGRSEVTSLKRVSTLAVVARDLTGFVSDPLLELFPLVLKDKAKRHVGYGDRAEVPRRGQDQC
ncbi:uncharacterized protein B0H64DRAFT_384688 [Chaetomium fimeti]|uniref:Uncharacterized protein n=1 Tax=Chaetomium fimeti TaxID=1854472 RepID=A0AAE0HKL3_9PEZI|nr:hypothetical protein B0H64DRAFT_384688 [Chaetomium fimeti]